ncbi:MULTISPECIES: thioredoxin family protein [Pseudomonas]|jgi:thioredoxin 1|uniref:thioredoxin family protein n=1 Tax=Pseudomonas TaxID=286 RepID=UPI00216A9F4C|nr:thioredoxin family protein [Pseudomonas grimontii]MCS3512464.1 thioredoxin 1 [Pseudomonas grimontii]
MGIATSIIASAKDYQRTLAEHPLLFMLFVSPHCPACAEATPLFEQIASRYVDQVKSMVLDTEHTPRHPEVNGTPTLLIFKQGQLVDKLKGLGPQEDQEHRVNELFSHYAKEASTR